MKKNIDETAQLYSQLYDNEDFTEFIENKYNIKDNETVPIYLESIEKYIDFLVENRQPADEKEYREKSRALLSASATQFWLLPAEECFETLIEMIKDEVITEEEIQYIVSTNKFYKGFRLFLISAFANRKKSKKKKSRNWSELDPIITQLIEKYFSNQMTK
ncbi:MAG: hypothetical protein E7354_00485 [Clostridiales bacterium]|nr:hypothetical protein [Clostridiales bacterium]